MLIPLTGGNGPNQLLNLRGSSISLSVGTYAEVRIVKGGA